MTKKIQYQNPLGAVQDLELFNIPDQTIEKSWIFELPKNKTLDNLVTKEELANNSSIYTINYELLAYIMQSLEGESPTVSKELYQELKDAIESNKIIQLPMNDIINASMISVVTYSQDGIIGFQGIINEFTIAVTLFEDGSIEAKQNLNDTDFVPTDRFEYHIGRLDNTIEQLQNTIEELRAEIEALKADKN